MSDNTHPFDTIELDTNELGAHASGANDPGADRPNILWLTYEDTSPQFVSCYGMTPVQTTPRMDELASEGVRFDNAFATAPVCSASRSALITGVCNEATGLGHHRSKYPIPRELIKGFPYYLQSAGYYTTNNVKTDYNIEDESDFIRETWDESSTAAHWRNRAAGRPFFSVFNYMDSHQSRTMTRPWDWYEEEVLAKLPAEQIVASEDIAVPPFYRDDAEMRRHLSRVYNSLRLCDLRTGERLDELAADGLLDETIIFCFADHGEGIPRGKCNGIGFGYRAACVAWFPPKYRHLSPWKAGTATDELVSFEDFAPTMLRLAGVTPPDHMTGRVLIGPARENPAPYIHAARNRLDDTPDLARSTVDGRFLYTRNYFPHLPVVKYQKYSDVSDILRAIRRDYRAGKLDEIQSEMVEPLRPLEYLFDLAADPWEIRNLAGDPAYRDDLERLRSETVEHARRVGDVMFLPESEMTERAGDMAPYSLRYDTRYNPLESMLSAADLVGRPEAIGTQLELLEHVDSAIRYWAAVGLFAAARMGRIDPNAWSGAQPPETTALRRHLDDPAATVRVEIAAAILGFAAAYTDAERPDAASDAVETLGRAISGGDVLVAHQALEKVLYLPQAAPLFRRYVDAAAERFGEAEAPPGSPMFPVTEAIDMYRYLYQDAPLLYEHDRPYLTKD